MRQVEIKVKGHVDLDWSDWFGGFEITHTADGSTLRGHIADQAELRGILSRLADLGLELLSVDATPRSRAAETPVTGGDKNQAKGDFRSR